jgi:eukaryotic-like serine/threonine-protein kinase
VQELVKQVEEKPLPSKPKPDLASKDIDPLPNPKKPRRIPSFPSVESRNESVQLKSSGQEKVTLKLNSRLLGLVVVVFVLFAFTALAIKFNLFAPKLGIGSTMIGNDNMTLFYVPAGEFTMGNDNDSSNEQPVHTVNLDAFWIDQTEVTNAMYAKCIDAGMCGLPSGTTQYNDPDYANHPVVYVSWDQAVEYCTWAERRLPTEAEWEKAASWDAKNQTKYVYPWGNDSPNNNLLNYNNAVGDTTDVGKYSDGASPYGALDMAGNVWEWVNDWYSETYDPSSPTDNPSGPDSGQSRVLRGGAWDLINYEVRSARRLWGNPTYTDLNLGFRCAMSASP